MKLMVERAKDATKNYTNALERKLVPGWFPREPHNYIAYIMRAQYGASKKFIKDREDRIYTALPFAFGTQWYQSGMPTFKISDALAAAFVLTDFDDVLFEDVKFPFESFCVRIDGVSPILTSEGQEIKSIAFMSGRSMPDGLTPSNRAELEAMSTDNFIYIMADDVKDDNKVWTVYQEFEPTDPVQQFMFDVLREYPKDGGVYVSMMRIAFGVATMLKNNHSDLTDALERTRKSRSSGPKGKPIERTYTEIVPGREVKIKDPLDLIAIARHVSSGEVPPDGTKTWKLKTQVLVRGHWRNQAHGPNYSLRKQIFVQPFMKGPDYAVRTERKFTLEEDEKY